jgi:hypothetical protein
LRAKLWRERAGNNSRLELTKAVSFNVVGSAAYANMVTKIQQKMVTVRSGPELGILELQALCAEGQSWEYWNCRHCALRARVGHTGTAGTVRSGPELGILELQALPQIQDARHCCLVTRCSLSLLGMLGGQYHGLSSLHISLQITSSQIMLNTLFTISNTTTTWRTNET